MDKTPMRRVSEWDTFTWNSVNQGEHQNEDTAFRARAEDRSNRNESMSGMQPRWDRYKVHDRIPEMDRRIPSKQKGPTGQLTRRVIMSGISKIALPNSKRDKDKEKSELHFRTVMVLHLQCKNISVLTMGALDQFENLKNLYLYKNNISRIQGLDFLVNLELLDLSRNNVERIDNLSKCQNLKRLYLGFNEIQVVEGVGGLLNLEELQIDDQDIPPGQPLIFSPDIMKTISQSLTSLDISSNQIPSLGPLANLTLLEILNAGDNNLKDIDEVLCILQTLILLRNLTLKGNPIAKKPTYKSSVIGIVYRLEMLDDKLINDTTRACVQKLRAMKGYRLQLRQNAQQQERLQIVQENMDVPSDFHFSTPTRLSPALRPPPTPIKPRRKPQVTPRESPNTDPDDTFAHENLFRSNKPFASSLSIAESEFKDDFNLDQDRDGMSDMAKIIFRLSNLDEGGDGDAKFHSSYWDLPGSSMIPECRPLSPLEGLDLAIPFQMHQSFSAPQISQNNMEKKFTISRPKPAAPGGRRWSNNSAPIRSSPDMTRLSEDMSQSQSYIYGRTLSPLIEMPTPESLTARDEK